MARILERGITLFHPYSRNKSDYADLINFSCCFWNRLVRDNGVMKLASAFNISPNLIHHFELVKGTYQTKEKQN